MKRPKEDPEDKKARLRERRLSEIDRQVATEANAAGLASDLRAIYGGFSGLKGKPSQPFKPTVAKPKPLLPGAPWGGDK